MSGEPAEALLINGEEIVALGKFAELSASAPSAAHKDLGGLTLIPGVIDSHVHVRELGMDAIKADLVGVRSAEEMVERLQAFAPDPTPGEWIIGQGWDEGWFGSEGYPDRAVLDEAFPNNPVALESLHGFAGFYNGRALEIAGVNADTTNPDGGTILKRENGEPTGVMLTLAQGLITQHIPEPSIAQREAAILAGLTTMSEAGVTSVHEAGMTRADVQAFQNLAARDALPIRVYGMLNGNDADLMRYWFDRGTADDARDFLDIRSIKIFYDGSLGSRTALMRAPYSDRPDLANPTERIAPARLQELSDEAAQKGFQMAVHAIGDEGNHRTLSIYEQSIAGEGAAAHRWRIEHAQIVLPDFYGRMADLGVIASVQSSHAVGDSGWAEDRVGPQRIRHGYAWQRILDAGGLLALNSDLPGEPWTPMETLYFGVTRAGLDGEPEEGWYADQALSVEEALYAMTQGSAYAAFQEDRLGSLAPGKWADFVILSDNPFAVTPSAIKDIEIIETWVAGKQIYTKAD